MAFCRLVFPLLVLSVVTASNVPVFLWGDLAKTSVEPNPLKTFTGPEFAAILQEEEAKNSVIAVFVEKTLSPEDFSLKENGLATLPYLHENLGNSLYLPAVEHPVRVLDALAKNNNKIQFITLEEDSDSESRFDTLRGHNDLISEEFSKLKKKNSNVVGVYTGRYPLWSIPVTHSRVRRQAENITNLSPPDYMLNGLRLYVTDIRLKTANSTSNITGFVNSESVMNETLMSNTMHFGETSLTLNFRSGGGYWFFDTVVLKQTNPTVDEVLYPTSSVEAILGFSYRCKQLVSFTSVNETITYTLTFEDMKVQPFFEATNETVMPFGDSINCVGFFSAPIWSGLFVVFILLSITFYGIMMMMDIRTMDRFDDPKGKTITINAGE